MDRIDIVGIGAIGYHGVYPEEKRDGQPFVVDLTCHIDLSAAAATDDLEQTESYAELSSLVVAHIENNPVDLIETLAGRIADDVLARTRAVQVEVTVHKPRAPMPVRVADVSVTIVRTRGPELEREVVFSLGSNLGDRLSNLTAAVAALAATEGLEIRGVSPVYETEAVGPVEQPDFLNIVVTGRSALSSSKLLARGLQIEAERGRERVVTQGPRTLDVDLITVGEERVDWDALTLPHPRAHERAFVLIPWHSLDPGAVIPGRGPVSGLLVKLDASGVRLRSDLQVPRP